jgi:hypothetical protein
VLLETEERLKLRSKGLVDTSCNSKLTAPSSLVDVLELCPVALGTSFLVVLELCPVARELRSPWSLLVDTSCDDKVIVPSSSSSSVALRTFSLIDPVVAWNFLLFIPKFLLIDIIFEGMITITWKKIQKFKNMIVYSR